MYNAQERPSTNFVVFLARARYQILSPPRETRDLGAEGRWPEEMFCRVKPEDVSDGVKDNTVGY